MTTTTKNRFIKEVKAVARHNPNVDMKLVREWQELTEMLNKIAPQPKPRAVKPPRLQPIPLRMFRQ